MKLYPWLLKPYKTIIFQHQIKKPHHAILIKTQKGIGVSDLIWYIGKWLLCFKPIGTKFCNKCHGCKLMESGNHPDWHILKNEKNSLFNIDDIRTINQKIFISSKQNGNKVVFLSNVKKLTKSAMNAFLKTLEEPPKKTWFFLVNYNYLTSYFTLNSRCILYKLLPPKEEIGLTWLKKETSKKNISHLAALRINEGSPISAKKFIDTEEWLQRIDLYENLFNCFKNQNLLKILDLLNKKNSTVKIKWICLLLFDGIKFSFSKNNDLINFDQIELIEFISYNYKYSIIDLSIRTWMLCQHRLLNIPGLNRELLLIEQLLNWEKILCFMR